MKKIFLALLVCGIQGFLLGSGFGFMIAMDMDTAKQISLSNSQISASSSSASSQIAKKADRSSLDFTSRWLPLHSSSPSEEWLSRGISQERLKLHWLLTTSIRQSEVREM